MAGVFVRTAAVLAFTVFTSSLSAQSLGFWYVDGQRGQDISTNGRSRATPWKTIAYAQTQIPPVNPQTQSRNWQTLFVVGDQVYSPSTNGETLPIVPVYNLFLEGTDTSAVPPIIKVDTGGTGLRFDPQVSYSRNPSTIRRLIFDGGDYGIEIGGSATERHRPRVQDCFFRNQDKAGVRIEASRGGTDPRFFQNTFQNGTRGIDIDGGTSNRLVVPDIEECFFHDLSERAISIQRADSGTGSLSTLVRSCRFWRCAWGAFAVDSAGATTRVRVFRSTFFDMRRAGVVFSNESNGSFDGTVMECSIINSVGGVSYGSRPGASGDHSFAIHNNVIDGILGSISFNIFDTGSIAIRTKDNLVRNTRTGIAIRTLPPSTVRLGFTSSGDRCLNNVDVGMALVTTAATTGAVTIENLICAGCPGIGLNTRLAAGNHTWIARHLTLADHGTGLSAATGQSFDHCIFAGNRTADRVGGPTITYSCLESTTDPGIGNLSLTDPQLLRPLYKLAPTSPCIDAADPNGTFAATDYEGDPRKSIGRANGATRADLGADEYVYAGSVRTYGPVGFGEFNFFPEISSPQQTIAIGQTLKVDLNGAIFPVFNIPATGAVLSIGVRDDSGMFPAELSAFGARGSLLLNDLQAFTGLVRVDGRGNATISLPIPVDPKLVGKTTTCQWLALLQRLNPLGLVTSNGLRVTFGR